MDSLLEVRPPGGPPSLVLFLLWLRLSHWLLLCRLVLVACLPGSPGSFLVRQRARERMEELGWTVEEQTFMAESPLGEKVPPCLFSYSSFVRF